MEAVIYANNRNSLDALFTITLECDPEFEKSVPVYFDPTESPLLMYPEFT